MEKLSSAGKILRFIYQQIYLRFNQQVREPYLIRIDRVFNNPDTNELTVAYHVANKRVSEDMTVTDFVKTDMIYLIDPRVAFNMGQQYGSHSEQLTLVEKKKPSLKTKAIIGLKRVFVDE